MQGFQKITPYRSWRNIILKVMQKGMIIQVILKEIKDQRTLSTSNNIFSSS